MNALLLLSYSLYNFNPLGQRSSGLMASLCVSRALSAVSSQISEAVEDLFFKFC